MGSSANAERLSIYFKSSPSFEFLRPFADPASFSVLVTGADGRPMDGGAVQIQLEAPASSRFFSTDFPVVEGTRLAVLSLPLARGRAEWKQLLPIRGLYRLNVEVSKEGDRLAAQEFDFAVRESEKKWFLLGGFLCLLFSAGLIAGRIFSGLSAHAVVAIIVAVLMGGGWIEAHDHNKAPTDTTATDALTVTPATVGKLSTIRWRLADAHVGDAKPTLLTLTITHLEKHKTVFAVEKVRVGREFSMDFQFADGAEHRVRAVAEPLGRQPLEATQLVNVTGVEPPVLAMVPAMALFVATLVAGLLAGRWSKRKDAV